MSRWSRGMFCAALWIGMTQATAQASAGIASVGAVAGRAEPYSAAGALMAFLAAVSLGPCLVIALAISWQRRRQFAACRFAAPEPVSWLVAERLVRGVQRRSGLASALAFGGAAMLFSSDKGMWGLAADLLGLVIAAIALCGLLDFVVARGTLQRIARGGVRSAHVFGTCLVVRDDDQRIQLVVTRRALARAHARALPTSIVRA